MNDTTNIPKRDKVQKALAHCTRCRDGKCTLGKVCPGYECFDYHPNKRRLLEELHDR